MEFHLNLNGKEYVEWTMADKDQLDKVIEAAHNLAQAIDETLPEESWRELEKWAEEQDELQARGRQRIIKRHDEERASFQRRWRRY